MKKKDHQNINTSKQTRRNTRVCDENKPEQAHHTQQYINSTRTLTRHCSKLQSQTTGIEHPPNIILKGNFNAKHTDWCAQQYITQSREISTQLDQLYMLNKIDTRTHPTLSQFQPHLTRYTFCSPDIAAILTWKTKRLHQITFPLSQHSAPHQIHHAPNTLSQITNALPGRSPWKPSKFVFVS